jgi:hypothetical protein
VTGLHRHADLAVRLETADSWPVARTGIDHDERTAPDIDLHSARRSDAHQPIVDRPLQLSAIDDQIDGIIEDMRRGFSQMFAVLNTALAHNIEEQDAALPGIHQILEG